MSARGAAATRRRRALLLLAVALASGGLAASAVHDRERRAAARLGPSVEVLVAARDLPAGARVGRGAVRSARVPERFVPPDALGSAAAVAGARVAVPVSAGSYLGAGLFEGAEGGGHGERVRRGRRVVSVGVAGGGALAGLAPGSRVDVLVSTEGGAGGGRTVMALAGAELLGMGETTRNEGGSAEAAATLRVTLRQAIYLTAADNFAREIRLLPRPPRDRSRAGAAVAQGEL
ncbi:MAG TPA: Flp pilus assembly protein CpaB [Thermoleophilaceae bacterium]|nr:Flp pilus assembly protein CpaB [Thermoleophilaceae bacterium]